MEIKSIASNKDWRKEFGIADAGPKAFFRRTEELNNSHVDVAQGHVVRRAFDLLDLDGVLCTENTPLVYFKEVNKIEIEEVARLHRKFWNHGGAPILVLVSPDQAHVYSGLVRPLMETDLSGSISGLVQILDRASAAIAEFLPSVESGEYFRKHEKSFNPAHRVDRDLLDNLQATREELIAKSGGKLDKVLDALLCRLVFACYLFDREIVGETYLQSIGLRHGTHLRDVLGVQPRPKAKRYLYDLFRKLGRDFNGDLFSDNLDAEARLLHSSFIDPLDDFFRATDVVRGQGSFWPYDFAAIPVEAISAIYERFLHGSDKLEGAFYTPRFLAELVLDLALEKTPSLLGRRYLDPACGSGIFLVALFNRMAEEWKRANPTARNDRRARELRTILCSSLSGVDISRTACRITAFSLYLAYLDQLSPRDVQELKEKGHRLPRLVHCEEDADREKIEGHIWCGDFFAEGTQYPTDADLVVGNPPWGSTAVEGTTAATWCSHPDHKYTLPDKQIAAAFIWKAAEHVGDDGKLCLVVPHSTLFNHTTTALDFQRTFFHRHAVDNVLNLADYRFFLFAEARHPAIVMAYRKSPPANPQHAIEYWAPKADWLVMQAEIITIPPEDRSTIDVGEVLLDLEGKDAPQIWKQRYWATGRDRRLLDRLSLYSRLRDHVRQLKEKGTNKRWVMAVGVQPVGKGDDPKKAETIQLPSRLFIEASASSNIDLFLLPADCTQLPAAKFTVRSGSNKDTTVFRSPHVLVAKGFTSVAFADFDVSFQDFLRGIHGPEADRDLLVFLAAYLRSNIARFFLFHTSSHWGITRQQVHVDELLRLPFFLPDESPASKRAWEIVKTVGGIVDDAAARSSEVLADREALVRSANKSIEPLLCEYFDVIPVEKALIDDTINVTIPSVLPTRKKSVVPTITPSNAKQLDAYANLLCDTLNTWAKNGPYVVQGRAVASPQLGIGFAVLQKSRSDSTPSVTPDNFIDLLPALQHLGKITSKKLNTFELTRGCKVFDGDRLYLVKPIGQRFWTQTAALNDADEIAGSILMQSHQRVGW